MARKKKNRVFYAQDQETQAGLQRLKNAELDRNRLTAIQASPYYGDALYGTDTDQLSEEYMGIPIQQRPILTDTNTEDALDEHGSFLDSWRLFNKKQTNSDLTAARQDLSGIEQQEYDLELAKNLVNNIIEFKKLSDQFVASSDQAEKEMLKQQMLPYQQQIQDAYEKIKTTGRQSDVLRSLFYDTNRDLDGDLLREIVEYNSIMDRGAVKDWNDAGSQIKNGWKNNNFSDFSGGILKGAWSLVEDAAGIVKNAFVSSSRGLGMLLPSPLGYEKGYNPFVDEAISESSPNDRRYDSLMIKGDEFVKDQSRLNKFNNTVAEWKEYLDQKKFDKTKDINDLQDKYINGSWYFNPKAIDPAFEKLQEKADLGIVGSILHPYYSAPELGSSFSDFKHFATLMATDIAIGGLTSEKALGWLVKKGTTNAIGGWYGKFINGIANGLSTAEAIQNVQMAAAAGETAANIYLTEQMRKNETKQEVFDAYNQRMTQDFIDAGIDINKVIEAGNNKAKELGLNIPLDPVEQFKNAILLDIDIDDPRYKQIADRNKVGLNKVYNENQTLAAKDFIEGFVFMPYAGKAMQQAFYRSNNMSDDLVRRTLEYQAGRKTSDKLEQLVKNGTATAKDKADFYINKFIDNRINSAIANPVTRVALTRPGKYIKEKAKQIMKIAPLEGIEEGQQSLLQQRYSEGAYDNYDRPQSDFDISSLFRDQKLGYEALATYLGTYVGDPTEQDLETRRAMNIGFTTALWFGAPHVLTNLGKTNEQNLRNLIAQMRTDMSLRKYVADTYARQEDDYKVGMLFDRYQKAGINAQRVIQSLEDMKKYKGGFQGDLVTDKYISDDQKLAAQTYNVFKSNVIEDFRKDQNVAKGSNEHKMLVQSAVRDIHDYENVLEKYNDNVEKLQLEKNKLINNLIKELQSSITTDPNNGNNQTVRSDAKYYTFLNKILEDFNSQKKAYSELRTTWNDSSKNKRLLADAQQRILNRRKAQLESQGVKITDEMWEQEKQQAKELAQDEVRKYVFDEYTEKEREYGAKGLEYISSLDEYARYTIDQLISAQQLAIHKRLIDDLSTKIEQMKFIQSELGSDINVDSIIAFVDLLKSQYKELKRQTNQILNSKNGLIERQNAAIDIVNQIAKAAGKKNSELLKRKKKYKTYRDIINEYGDYGDMNELLKAMGLGIVNKTLLQTLKPRVDVFTKGYVDPLQINASTRKRNWKELTEAQRQEYRKKVKDQAQKEGKSEPSEKSIASKYNTEQRNKSKELSFIKKQFRKKLAEIDSKSQQEKTLEEIDNEDLFQLGKSAAKAYVQQVLNERIDNYQERKKIYHLSYQDPVTVNIEDSSAPTYGNNEDTSAQTEGLNEDSTVTTEGQNTEPDAGMDANNPANYSEMSDAMKETLGLNRVGETPEEKAVADMIGERGPVEIEEPKSVDEKTEQEAAHEDADKRLPQIPVENKDDLPDNKDLNEGDPNQVETPESQPEPEESEPAESVVNPNGDIESQQTLEVGDEVSPSVENESEGESVDTADENTSDNPVETIDEGEESYESLVMPPSEESAESTNPDHDNNSYDGTNDETQNDDYENMGHGRNVPKHPKDVQSSDEALGNYLSSTFFYSVDPKTRQTPVTLAVNEQKLQTTYPIKPAKELGEKLLDKKWIYTCDCYYVCSGNIEKKGTKNKDAITVSLIIDDHKTKSTYVCFLRTPGKYKYGASSNQYINGEDQILESLYKIGLDDSFIVEDERGNKKLDYKKRNENLLIAIRQKYQMTGKMDPAYSGIADPQQLKRLSGAYIKEAVDWYNKQSQDIKDEVFDTAHKMMAKKGKRVLTSAEMREQIDRLKAARNAIIDKYCSTSQDGVITIPTTIKKNVRPSSSNICVSNGRINNQVDEFGIPVFRSLTEVSSLGLSNETEDITRKIEDGTVQFGFGRGKWGNNPYAISSVTDPSVDFETGPDAGKSGSIYIMVNTGQNKLVPVLLKPQRFSDQETEDGSFYLNRYPDTLQLCIDPNTGKINAQLRDGKAVKPSLAEIILFMVCGKLNVENLPSQDRNLNQIILDLIVNTGEHTLLDPDARIQNDIKQLADKQIAVIDIPMRDGTEQTRLVIGRVDDDGNRRQEVYDIDEIFSNDELRRDVVYTIKENLHWNTQVEKASEKNRSVAMTDQFPILLQNALTDYFEQNPEATEYRFCGLRKVSFKKQDLFKDEDGRLVPKKCNILSWMIVNGHIETDLGDTVFRDPFVFASGIEEKSGSAVAEITEQHPQAATPAGPSIITAEAENKAVQKSRASEEKIDVLSKQKSSIGKFENVNKNRIRRAVTQTEEERKQLLDSMDGIFDVIALAVQEPSDLNKYLNDIKSSIQDYIDFANKEGKLGKKLNINDIDLSVVNKDNVRKVLINGYTPILQISNDGKMSLQFRKSSNLFDNGKRITGVFSKVKEGRPITEQEARKFLSETLGIDDRNVVVLDKLYDVLTNEEAYGMLQASLDFLTGENTGVIMLSRSNNFGSTYHEAFHYANLLLNSSKERISLYKYFVEHYRKDLKNAKLSEIEEALAAKFQEYMDDRTDLSILGKVKRFFQRIWDFINIFNRKDLVHQTYETLRKGGYKSRKIDETSLRELKKVYDKNKQNNVSIPGISRNITKNLPAEISDARTFYNVATAMANRFLSENTILRPSDLKKMSGTPYTDFMNMIKEEAKEEQDPVKRALINAVVDNPKAFQATICRAFDEYGIKVRFGRKKIKVDDLQVEIQPDDDTAEGKKGNKVNDNEDFIYDIENLALSKKDNAAFRAKLFLGLIEERRFAIDDITGERITVPLEDDFLGYPVYKPFSESWSKIVKDCWACETYDEIDPESKNPENPYAKNSFRYEVRFRAKSDEFYAALDEKLDQCYYINDDLQKVPDIELQNQILSTIKSSFPQLGYAKISTSRNVQRMYDNPDVQDMSDSQDYQDGTIATIPSDIQKDFSIFSDNTYRSKRMLPREWSKQAIISGVAKYQTSNSGELILTIDKDYVTKVILPRMSEVENELFVRSSTKRNQLEKRKITNEDDAKNIYYNTIYKITDIMSFMGIPSDEYTLEYLMFSLDGDSQTKYVNRCAILQDILTKKTGSLGFLIHNVIEKNVGKNDISFTKINDKGQSAGKKTTPIEEMYYGYSDDTFITRYAIAYSAVHPSSQDFSVQSPDNKKLYPIGDNNYITDTIRRANYDIDDFVKNRNLCPYQRNSILMQVAEAIKRGGAKKEDMLKLVAFIGLKDADKNEGVDYFGMTRMEDYVSKMVLTFGDISEDGTRLINRAITLPTMADKKTYYAITGRLLDDLMCDDVITRNIETENENVLARRFSGSTLIKMHKYFLSELETIEQYYDRKNIKYLAEHPGQRKKNYHGKRINIGTKENPIWTLDISGNGGMFRYCYDFIIDPETGLNLNEMIEAKYRIQENNENGNGEFREGENEIDGFENVRKYLSQIRKRYGKFNAEIADGINKHLISLVENELESISSSSDMRIVEKVRNEQTGGFDYRPTKIPKAIIQYYIDRIQKGKGDKFKERAYGFGVLNNEAAYCAVANHCINTVISMIEYEKMFSGDQAQYKWSYFGKKPKLYNVEVDGVTVGIRKLRDKNVDRVKRLGAGLSPGKNIRTNYSQDILEKYPELKSDRFTNAYMNDIETVSNYINEVENRFKADRIGEALRSMQTSDVINDMELIDDILEKSGAESLQKFIHGLYYNFKNKQGESYYEISENVISSRNPQLMEIINNEVARQAFPYKGINVSDAQVLIRPALYRKIRIGLGEWSMIPDQDGYSDELAYQILEKDDSWMIDPEKAKIVKHLQLYPLKMTYFDTNPETESPGKYLGISRYNKQAIFPLFKYIATSETGSKLYERMNRKGNELDMLTFDSAVKVGANQSKASAIKNDNDLSQIDETLLRDSDKALTETGGDITKDNISGIDALPVQIQSLSRLLKQLNTEAHTDEERSIGSQMFKIAFSDIINEDFYGCDEDGTGGRSGKEIRTDIMACIDALTERGQRNIVDLYKLGGEWAARRDAQTDLIRQIIKTNDLGSNALDIINGKGCVASLNTRRVFEQAVSKKVNANVVEIHTKGGTAIQQSVFGFVGYNNNAVTSYNGNYSMFNDGKNLEWNKKDGSMEVILSMNFFKAVVPQKYQDTYANMRQWLIDHDIIKGHKSDGTMANPKPFGVGYRIPTQGMSSMFVFTVADVLPEQSGDLIIVPEEFTAQTGSDFDVDKLFLATMSYTKQEDESVLEGSDIFDQSVGKSIIKKKMSYRDESVSDGAIQNRLLQNYITIISDKKNFALSRASIDVYTSIITDEILPKLRDTKDQYVIGMSELSPMYQSERKMEFTTGKSGIGPFALNITNHALTQYADLCMDYGANEYKLGKLNAITGQDGRHILGWLSAMVNAHVDVAKDPYVFTLNVNKITYNMTNFLIRAGKGKATFSFIAQPILKEYANKLNSEGGFYGNNDGKVDNQASLSKRKENLKRALLMKYYKQMIANYKVQRKDLTEDRQKFWDEELGKIQVTKAGGINVSKCSLRSKVLSVNEEDIQTMLNCSKSRHSKYFKALYYQILTMKAFDSLEKYADEMSALVMNSRIDTKKFGNNIADQLNFLNNYNQFKYNNDKVYWYIDIPGESEEDHAKRIKDIKDKSDRSAIQKYFEDTFLDYKLIQATSLERQILYGQAFSASDTFRDTFINVMCSLYGQEDIYNPAFTDDNGDLKPDAPKGYSRVYNKKSVQQVATAIENLFRARCLVSTNNYQDTNEDYTGPIDFTFGGDKQLILSTIQKLLYGDENTSPLVQRIANFIKYLKTPPQDANAYEQWESISTNLIDSNGNIKNDFLNFLNPIPPTKKYPQARLLLKENAYDRSSIRKDVLTASYNDLLTHNNPIVRRLAREIAVYAFYTSYDENTRESFFELVPPYFRQQYDDMISRTVKGENMMKKVLGVTSDYQESNRTVDEKYEDIVDAIARNYWYDSAIIPAKLESGGMGKPKDAWQLDRGDFGLVPVKYKNMSKRKIKTYGIIITDQNNGDYFTVTHDKDVYLYKKIGTIDVTTQQITAKGNPSSTIESHDVYIITPKLGKHDGKQHSYELINGPDDYSVYEENQLPVQFQYNNLMLTINNWISKPQRVFEKPYTKKDGTQVINKTATFRLIKSQPIRGQFVEYSVRGDNFLNVDGTIRFIPQKNPTQFITKNSTFVLNFGTVLKDDLKSGKIIDITESATSKQILKSILDYLKKNNYNEDTPIKIGQFGGKLSVKVSQEEVKKFIDYHLNEYSKELYLKDNLSEDEIGQKLEDYKKNLSSVAEQYVAGIKQTQLFIEVLQGLLMNGFQIDTTYSYGLSQLEHSFLNASRVMIEDVRYRQSYVVFPQSMMNVDKIDQYEALAESYDYAPEYVINDVEQQEIQDVADGAQQTVVEQPEQIVQQSEESSVESPNKTDNEETDTGNEDQQIDVASEVVENAADVLNAVGIDLTSIQNNITKQVQDNDEKTHENC